MEASFQGKMGSLARLGVDPTTISNIASALAIQRATTPPNAFEYRPRAKAHAALESAATENRRGSAIAPELRGQAHVAAWNFRNNAPSPTPGAAIDHVLVNQATAAWRAGIPLDQAISPDRWRAADKAPLQRVGKNLANEYYDALEPWAYTPTDANLAAAMAMLEHAHTFDGLTDGLINDPWAGLRVRNLATQPGDPFA
jgi:hypothetical protein